MKDGGIDLDAVLKNHDENIGEESWKKVLKPIIKNCYKKLTPKKEEFQKKAEAAPFNIKNCDVQYAAMNTCITIDAFSVILLILTVDLILHETIIFVEVPSGKYITK